MRLGQAERAETPRARCRGCTQDRCGWVTSGAVCASKSPPHFKRKGHMQGSEFSWQLFLLVLFFSPTFFFFCQWCPTILLDQKVGQAFLPLSWSMVGGQPACPPAPRGAILPKAGSVRPRKTVPRPEQVQCLIELRL